MTGKAIGWAFDQRIENPTRKLVLLCLADATDHHGICWPGFKTIAEKTSLSRETIIRAIKDLEKSGHLEKVTRQTGSNRFTSNAYRLSIFKGCIDDHPLSGLFKSSVTETPPSVTETPPSVTETPPSVTETPPSVTETPLEPLINPQLIKKEKNALTREEFLRVVNKAWHSGELDLFNISEELAAFHANAVWDHWNAKGEWPGGDPVSIIRNWIRNGIQRGKIKPQAQAESSENACEGSAFDVSSLADWQRRLLDQGLSKAVIRSWFLNAEYDGNETLIVPKRFHADFIRQNFQKEINAVLPGVIITTETKKEQVTA